MLAESSASRLCTDHVEIVPDGRRLGELLVNDQWATPALVVEAIEEQLSGARNVSAGSPRTAALLPSPI